MESLKNVPLKDSQIRIWGKITDITEVEEVGNNNTLLQKITVYVKPVRNENDNIVGKEQYWRFDLLGQKVEQYKLEHVRHVDKRICVIAWANSALVQSNTAGNPDMYIVNVTVHQLELL